MHTKWLFRGVALYALLIAPPGARAQTHENKFTAADVRFVSGMIHHHAQAIIMARMAPTHGASPTILTLTGRIINAQQDEITVMQQWLRDRKQPVPDVEHMLHGMAGMEHTMHMPGMLTKEQLEKLDAAHGQDFDDLFLKFMIQHHQGAVAMVKELVGSEGAAQDDTVFKLASDINVDQTTEIARMQRMLVDQLFGKD
jgi:uncharacterized protein (DUF305 family)